MSQTIQKYCTIAARKNQGAAFLRPFLGGMYT